MLKKIYNVWQMGLDSMFVKDEITSFYLFFTTLLAEIAFLWIQPSNTTIPFTIILSGYIGVVMVFARFKEISEDLIEVPRAEFACSMVYIICLLLLVIAGCTINILQSLILIIIPMAIVIASSDLVEYNVYTNKSPTVRKILETVVNILYTLVIIAPVVALAICFFNISSIMITWKIIIFMAYLICIPFISYYEDYSGYNIFELGDGIFRWNRK